MEARGAIAPKSPPVPWIQEARLLMERDLAGRDGHDWERVAKVLRWCQADDFWQNNILSMPKFRKQYPQLSLKMDEAIRRNPGLKMAQTDEEINLKRQASSAIWDSLLNDDDPQGRPEAF